MNPQLKTFIVGNKRLLQFLLIFFASIFLMKGMITPGVARSQEERELEDKIPKHLPIKVKIKKEKEKAFKDLKNEKWVRDFQLEITNTGNKPIYFLSLSITLPELTAPDGKNIGLVVHYGRGQLINVETKATRDDIPIMPGETYVFSFPGIVVESWEGFKQREKKPDPKKLILRFQALSFGDGTGFVGRNGMTVPRPPNESSSLDGCKPEPSLNDSSGIKVPQVSWRNQPAIFSTKDLPATFLLANFLFLESSQPIILKTNPQSGLCCPGNQCFRSRPYGTDCICGGTDALEAATCSDPFGGCWLPEYTWIPCGAGYCLQTDFAPCGGTTPTPEPTATTTPTPTPECPPENTNLIRSAIALKPRTELNTGNAIAALLVRTPIITNT